MISQMSQTLCVWPGTLRLFYGMLCAWTACIMDDGCGHRVLAWPHEVLDQYSSYGLYSNAAGQLAIALDVMTIALRQACHTHICYTACALSHINLLAMWLLYG